MTEALLVIGASGFVGRNLVRRMAGKVRRLYAVTGRTEQVPEAHCTTRLADLDDLPELPADTVVVQLAAHRYDATRFEVAQSDLLNANIDITNRVFRFCVQRGLREIRLASSVAVYPAGLDVLDDEAPIDLNAPPNPNEDFYAWSKRWAELAARLHRNRFGINTISFRLSNPYGPWDSTDPGSAHVLPAFVMRALTKPATFAIKGNPKVERDFIFVEDVVDVLERSFAVREMSDAFNLCRGETTTLSELAEKILEIADVESPVVAPDTVTHGVLARRPTNRRVKEVFGKEAFAPLEVGLRPTIEWYRDER